MVSHMMTGGDNAQYHLVNEGYLLFLAILGSDEVVSLRLACESYRRLQYISLLQCITIPLSTTPLLPPLPRTPLQDPNIMVCIPCSL
jgi:hypothetical protein